MIERLRARALELGFIATGFSRPAKPLFFDQYRRWVDSGKMPEWFGCRETWI
jgi:hypothetical protein